MLKTTLLFPLLLAACATSGSSSDEVNDGGACAETNYQVAAGGTVSLLTFGYADSTHEPDIEEGLPAFVVAGGPEGSCLGDEAFTRVLAWSGTEVVTATGHGVAYSEDVAGTGDLVEVGGYNHYLWYSWPTGLGVELEVVDDAHMDVTFTQDDSVEVISLFADDSGVVVE